MSAQTQDMQKVSAYAEFAEKFLDAWNAQDVDAVLSFYADNVTYRDPNTKGNVEGADAMRKYLTKLFASWTMRWSTREMYPLADKDGVAFLWRASIRKSDGTQTVEVDGMDLVLIEGGKVKRNDVYFDRAVLAPLLGF